MEKIYFANKIFRKKYFGGYAKYYSDQIGCHVSNSYYLDKKIYPFRLVDGKYVDFDGNEYQELVPPWHHSNVLPCWECEHYDIKPVTRDCENRPEVGHEIIGIANVYELTQFFEKYSQEEALKIISLYNNYLDTNSAELKYISIGNYFKEDYDKTNKKTNAKVRKYLKKYDKKNKS